MITWRDLTTHIEEKGLLDIPLAQIHVMLDSPEDEGCIDIFKNVLGTVTISNSCCK